MELCLHWSCARFSMALRPYCFAGRVPQGAGAVGVRWMKSPGFTLRLGMRPCGRTPLGSELGACRIRTCSMESVWPGCSTEDDN